ncbi:hypothetical protein [Embleya scabrispora]|uniref:hypothetical protein n=1 Tax=Embleya scabrispora TaxID=159449 RepID=UPI00037C0C0A|nr:hypothetical protein [Embleya scabrispora]MYS84632.1 hypothetical protein [Streptomyces sp. SID5474]
MDQQVGNRLRNGLVGEGLDEPELAVRVRLKVRPARRSNDEVECGVDEFEARREQLFGVVMDGLAGEQRGGIDPEDGAVGGESR